MKLDKAVTAVAAADKKRIENPLPLIDDTEDSDLNKTNSIQWTCYADPKDTKSALFKKAIRILNGRESVRKIIKWKADVIQAFQPQTEYAKKKTIAETCMAPMIKTSFNQFLIDCKKRAYETAYKSASNKTNREAVQTNGVDHYQKDEQIEEALDELVKSLLPRKVLERAKRAMRREMRKPIDMPVRTYVNALFNLNSVDRLALSRTLRGRRLLTSSSRASSIWSSFW